MLTQNSNSPSYVVSPDDPYIIDMIKLADQRMAQLQKDLDETNQFKILIDNKLINLKNQVRHFINYFGKINKV